MCTETVLKVIFLFCFEFIVIGLNPFFLYLQLDNRDAPDTEPKDNSQAAE